MALVKTEPLGKDPNEVPSIAFSGQENNEFSQICRRRRLRPPRVAYVRSTLDKLGGARDSNLAVNGREALTPRFSHTWIITRGRRF